MDEQTVRQLIEEALVHHHHDHSLVAQPSTDPYWGHGVSFCPIISEDDYDVDFVDQDYESYDYVQDEYGFLQDENELEYLQDGNEFEHYQDGNEYLLDEGDNDYLIDENDQDACEYGFVQDENEFYVNPYIEDDHGDENYIFPYVHDDDHVMYDDICEDFAHGEIYDEDFEMPTYEEGYDYDADAF